MSKWRNDVLLLVGLLVAGAILGIFLYSGSAPGEVVLVSVSGEEMFCYALSEDITVEIPCKDGRSDYLRIERGQAWMEDAQCPDRLCVKMGKISKEGQTIVCLPNQVVIEIAKRR